MGCQHLFQRLALAPRPLLLTWSEETGEGAYCSTECIILGSDTAAFNIFTNGEVQWGTVNDHHKPEDKSSRRRLALNDEEACFGGWGQDVAMLKQKNVLGFFCKTTCLHHRQHRPYGPPTLPLLTCGGSTMPSLPLAHQARVRERQHELPHHINIMYGDIIWSMLRVIERQIRRLSFQSDMNWILTSGLILYSFSLLKRETFIKLLFFGVCFYINRKGLHLG